MTASLIHKAKKVIAKHMGIPVKEVEVGIDHSNGISFVMKVNHGPPGEKKGKKMAEQFTKEVHSGKFDIRQALPGFSSADTPSAPLTLKHYKPDVVLKLKGDEGLITPSSMQKAAAAIAKHMGIPVNQVELGIHSGSDEKRG